MDYVKVICKIVEENTPKGITGLESDMRVDGTGGVTRVVITDTDMIKQTIPWHNIIRIIHFKVQDKVDEPVITEEVNDIQEIGISKTSDIKL